MVRFCYQKPKLIMFICYVLNATSYVYIESTGMVNECILWNVITELIAHTTTYWVMANYNNLCNKIKSVSEEKCTNCTNGLEPGSQ